MEQTKDKIVYGIMYAVLWVHSILPFWMLYILSDLLYFPLYYVVKYRKKVVYKNMRESFPDKSEQEIERLMKGFYHHFCDYVVETIKLLNISDKATLKRCKMENTETLQRSMDNNEQVIVMLGHYGNWELLPSLSLHLNIPRGGVVGEVYRPLRSKGFDRLFLKLRSRYNTTNIPKNSVVREIIRYKISKTPVVIGFMADQTPSGNNLHYWTNFLSHDTPMLTGIERIAAKAKCTLVYADVVKERRGYYKIIFKEITKEPQKYAEFEITEIYTQLMEETILRAPQYWLWTHKRWKYKRQ